MYMLPNVTHRRVQQQQIPGGRWCKKVEKAIDREKKQIREVEQKTMTHQKKEKIVYPE